MKKRHPSKNKFSQKRITKKGRGSPEFTLDRDRVKEIAGFASAFLRLTMFGLKAFTHDQSQPVQEKEKQIDNGNRAQILKPGDSGYIDDPDFFTTLE